MTEDKKPSWQYVPPTTTSEDGVVDATKYMKGAPRRSTSNPSAPQNSEERAQTKQDAADKQDNTQATSEANTETYEEVSRPEASEYTPSADRPRNRERRSNNHENRGGRQNRRRNDSEEASATDNADANADKKPYNRAPRNSNKKKGFLGWLSNLWATLTGKKKAQQGRRNGKNGQRRRRGPRNRDGQNREGGRREYSDNRRPQNGNRRRPNNRRRGGRGNGGNRGPRREGNRPDSAR